MPLLDVGRRLTSGRGLPLALGAMFLGGMSTMDPLEPVADYVQETTLGDPEGFQIMMSDAIVSRTRDVFAGDAARKRIQELRSPLPRGKQFAPPGEMVFGMYNSRVGGR